ncbi:MAG: ankyrin repeat domain-containing protein [Chitinophagaceae bacterium]
MNTTQVSTKRRNLLKQAMALVLSFTAVPAMAKFSRFEETASEPLPANLVHEFVAAAHVNLVKVKEMLSKESHLANACWDWGGGDFEVALGGPSHMGNRDVANYLLDNNARMDIFCAAMLGHKGVVEALITTKPAIANVTGPHQFPLLYHVAISGDVGMADIVKPHINSDKLSPDCNRSLQAAARDGHITMIEWLFANGVDNASQKDVLGRTPLKIAEEKGYTEVIMLLKKHGAK